ncbi:zinc finger, C3HC4 type (RING finger) domain protein [Toxoplasma gondii CAST]|uniref:E3 ubiquitin protein ligase n=2 Tax=Toxoplasma gondii TaxID=5811 RepID=A0A2G8XNX4_TOXGO|nr:zinc finger, C3HC4 type (RING finger) domain-containing protein [Toxoplasma gondii COUG]RQX67210.1 zinc finger, C3HC4 type (RING finger) domain protein [Toxoplasma gondii CAST]
MQYAACTRYSSGVFFQEDLCSFFGFCCFPVAHTAALEELSIRDLQLLKDENETMRRRLVCFVCNERFKDHMINKCGHMFCQVCLERNVKTRNRKCPHCKAQFDQKDIRKVYLDN